MRASGGETAGAITTSYCAPARLRQHHDTVPYREALVSWLLRERLGQADQNDLIWDASTRDPRGAANRAYRRVRARPKPRRQSRYVTRLPAILAELCRIVHR